jgi:DNA-directed RNA polymerase specialized sigma24 family protein
VVIERRVDYSSARELERVRKYEHAALARLFDRYYDSVHGFIFALLGDAVAAEELASLVFQRLLDSLVEITGRGAGLEGWLYTTAFRLAAGRRRATRPKGPADALWSLPADEREIIALRLLGGLDAERVAAATGRPRASVVSAQLRALRRLAGQHPQAAGGI